MQGLKYEPGAVGAQWGLVTDPHTGSWRGFLWEQGEAGSPCSRMMGTEFSESPCAMGA